MTTRPEITPWARSAAQRAIAASAREIWRDTPFTCGDIVHYLELGEVAGLTITETLLMVERAVAENRRPDEALRALALMTPTAAPIDLTTEERELFLADCTEAVARAMVRWVVRKAKEAAEARGEEADRG